MKKLLALVLSLMALCCFALAEDVQPIYTEDFEDGVHDVYLTSNCEAGCIAEVAEEDGNKYLRVVTHTGDAENGYVQVAFGPDLRNFDYTVRVRPYIKNPDWNWMKVVLRGLDGTTIEMVGDGYENEAYLFNIWEWRGVFAIKSMTSRKLMLINIMRLSGTSGSRSTKRNPARNSFGYRFSKRAAWHRMRPRYWLP